MLSGLHDVDDNNEKHNGTYNEKRLAEIVNLTFKEKELTCKEIMCLRMKSL